MKKVIQPNQTVRKVYGGQSLQQESQMNAVRKIHNLLSSGAVTVTGPTQPRILKQKMPITTNIVESSTNQSRSRLIALPGTASSVRCYMCDETVGNQGINLAECVTQDSNIKLSKKIGQIVGNAFMVIIGIEDKICKRCLSLINQIDRLETDLEKVKNNVMDFFNRKYNLDDGLTIHAAAPPCSPAKLQKMSNSALLYEGKGNERKSIQYLKDPIENQLSNLFDEAKEVSASVGLDLSDNCVVQSEKMSQQQKKTPIKIYKCMWCDFKTTDLKLFQPHHEICKQQNGYRCKNCKQLFPTISALKQHIAEKHSSVPFEHTCLICNITFNNEVALKRHTEMNHSENKPVDSENISPLFSCNLCNYRTSDKQNYDEHCRKHIRVKPFKCRICNQRFESRDLASLHAKTHQTNFFKCGSCAASFPQREQLIKHCETHQSKDVVSSSQKQLQYTIDDALRETGEDLNSKGIHFFSCTICSLTFIQETYYNQHMETHKREPQNLSTVASVGNLNMKHATKVLQTYKVPALETDIESLFEKMHSEKAGTDTKSPSNNDKLVITSQENPVGEITFNITIPQPQESETDAQKDSSDSSLALGAPKTNATIDMPVLDHATEADNEALMETQQSKVSKENDCLDPVVNMPSLDNETAAQNNSNDQIPMEIDDPQNSAQSGSIKFILNENGQILEFDNHIITTDADGNQIFVQGTDSEQIQQLLQSVGVLQSSDGFDSETLQMIGDNNQMIIVQQTENESQLIDESLLQSDGHIVLQQTQEGDITGGKTQLQEAEAERTTITNDNETNIHKAEQHYYNSQIKTDQKVAADATRSDNIDEVSQSMTNESFFGLEDLMQQSSQK